MIDAAMDWTRREGLYASAAVLIALTAFHLSDPVGRFWPKAPAVTTAAVAAPVVEPPKPPPIAAPIAPAAEPVKKPVKHKQAKRKPQPQPPAQTFLFWSIR